MSHDRAAERTATLLSEWAHAPGRAAAVRVQAGDGDGEFAFGVYDDEPFAAASLLKLPLAFAAEAALSSGALDPELAVPVTDVRSNTPGALQVLAAEHRLTAGEILGLSLCLSDNDCADWLFSRLGLAAVRAVLAAWGLSQTHVSPAARPAVGPLQGTTTAADALIMIDRATDSQSAPRTAAALTNTLHASRIPLGATDADVRIAHKTGSLTGVAHDAAVLDCDDGTIHLVFLSADQHDTLVTGYEMGLCTRSILEAWRFGVRRTAALS